LYYKKADGCFLQYFTAIRFPNQIKGNAHHNVQGCPNRCKYPAGRVPRRFINSLIPAINTRSSKQTSCCPHGHRNCNGDYKFCTIIHRKITTAGKVLFKGLLCHTFYNKQSTRPPLHYSFFCRQAGYWLSGNAHSPT
jgi:hypothetical protein